MSIEMRKEVIDNLTKEINAIKATFAYEKEKLARKYKERGDQYINLFLDIYVLNNNVDKTCAEASFDDYSEASKLFDAIGFFGDCISSMLALGNAYKEAAVPALDKDGRNTYFEKAKEAYLNCINVCSQDMNRYAQDYYFVTLEQMNLMARMKAINSDGNPKRINIYHSLKSPESHWLLHGLYYFALKNNIELWEYRYGKVLRLDEESKFIEDRLGEACALIILASEDYDVAREVIEKELNGAFERSSTKDPLVIYAIGIGNNDLMRTLENRVNNLQNISEGNVEDIFKSIDMKNIYDCRRERHFLAGTKMSIC